MQNDVVVAAIVVLVVLWSLYRRLRRSIGRQRVDRRSLAARSAIFAAIGILTLVGSIASPIALVGGIVGLAVGAVVAWYSLKLTTFESDPKGLYYRSNRYIGLAVFAIFLVRLVFNFLPVIRAMRTGGRPFAAPPAAGGAGFTYATHNPVNTAVILLTFGYYLAYYVGLLRASTMQPQTGDTAASVQGSGVAQ